MYKLVIVEDEYIEREALSSLIDWESMGLSLAGCFESGEDALAFARENEFHVLFTDIRLLGMSGLDLAMDIMNIHPSVKIIINSGYSDFEYARKAIRVKAISYLTKPLDLQELRDTVKETLTILSEENSNKQTIEKLGTLIKAKLPLIRKNVMESINNGMISGDDAAEALQVVGMESDRNIIRHIMAHIAEHTEERLTAEHLGDIFHFSPSYIGIAFKKGTGKTLTDYVRDVRMQKARELLLQPGSRIGEVAAQVGYPNISYFCAVFKKEFGMNPGEYREHA